MKQSFFILITFLIFSCSISDYKTIDFDSFEITVPRDWKKCDVEGIDSYVGGLITNTNDTLIFDLGLYSPDVSRNDFPLVFDAAGLAELTTKERALLPQTKHLIVDSFTEDINFNEYLKYTSEYDSIACFRVKFITPKNKGFGATGIYIDSLSGSSTEYNKMKFGFYGKYLSDSTQLNFIKALKTLRFEKYCSK